MLSPIIVASDMEQAVASSIEVTICTTESLETLRRLWKNGRLRKRCRVQIKVDTGMSRLGFSPETALQIVRELDKANGVVVTGLYSHCATAEDISEYMQTQKARMESVVEASRHENLTIGKVHMANSAAILFRRADVLYDMVRPGITLYGLCPAGDPQGDCCLQPAMALKSTVIRVDRVSHGDFVSYGGGFRATEDMIVATIGIGYADGVPRALSNRMEVVIQGLRAKQIGNVTMEYLMADVSRHQRVEVGDEVLLFGSPFADAMTANEWAALVRTIPYEIVARLPDRLERRFIHGGNHNQTDDRGLPPQHGVRPESRRCGEGSIASSVALASCAHRCMCCAHPHQKQPRKR
jgi:alanine racemase